MGMNTITRKATFALNATETNAVDVRGLRLVSLQMPDDWTAADLGFQATILEDSKGEPTGYVPVYDDTGAALVLTVDKNQFVTIDYGRQPRGAKWIKLNSAGESDPVAQEAARTITLSFVKDRMA